MMRTLLILLLFVWAGAAPAAAAKRVPILTYHSIAEFTGSGIRDLYVSPENFAKQMRYLKENGYTPLTFERWNDIPNVKKPVLITFDDGYKNVQNAYTVFKNLQDNTFQPAGTIFAIADFLNRPQRLSPAELKDLSDSGFFSIQSHTATHPDLRNVTNYEYELTGAKEKLEAITGKPVFVLSYPYGFFNDKVVAAAKQDYGFAVTVKPGVFQETGQPDELYRLPRVNVTYDMTLEEFGRALE